MGGRRSRALRAAGGALIVPTALLALPGCVSDDVSPEQSWCTALCAVERDCYPVESCTSDCLDRNDEYLDRMSAAHLKREIACYQDATGCAVDQIMDSCYLAALDNSTPTDESAAFCHAMGRPFFECNWYGSPSACAQDFGPYSAAALEPVADACGSATCDDLETCLIETLWE